MSWLDDLPKIELHLHLEGAIPIPALWRLIENHGGDPSVPDIYALVERFQFTDFRHFISTWMWKSQFLKTYEDFEFIAAEFARSLKAQNIRYAEVFYSPAEHTSKAVELKLPPKDLNIRGISLALRKGLDKVSGVRVALVPDLVRGLDPATMLESLAEIEEVREEAGIIGIGLGGAEQLFPCDPYGEVYERARSIGLHTTAHAGEVKGPESIWAAITKLGVERIGHATSAQQDESLIEYLLDHQLCLEMCPLSNLRTASIASIADHPVRRFFDAGLLVTVNTDDPEMFNNTLVEEFETLMDVHQFTEREICQLLDNGIEGSWLSDDDKRDLHKEFHAHPGWVKP